MHKVQKIFTVYQIFLILMIVSLNSKVKRVNGCQLLFVFVYYKTAEVTDGSTMATTKEMFEVNSSIRSLLNLAADSYFHLNISFCLPTDNLM